jgi:hypothetical protein
MSGLSGFFPGDLPAQFADLGASRLQRRQRRLALAPMKRLVEVTAAPSPADPPPPKGRASVSCFLISARNKSGLLFSLSGGYSIRMIRSGTRQRQPNCDRCRLARQRGVNLL